MKRSNELRCDDAPEASQQSGGECYSSDRRLGGGGCWYRTAITHNIMGTSALWVPSTQATAERSPPSHTHAHTTTITSPPGWRSYLFLFPSFPFFPSSIYVCALCVCCVCHIIMNVMGLVGRAVGKTALRLFLSLSFLPYNGKLPPSTRPQQQRTCTSHHLCLHFYHRSFHILMGENVSRTLARWWIDRAH